MSFLRFEVNGKRKRIAMISEHASPLSDLGGVDSGGQNVYVAHVARHLARLGYHVDVFTRRDSQDLPDVYEWKDGVRVVHVPAGPPAFVPKEELFSFMPQFSEFMIEFMEREGSYDLVHANFWMSGWVAVELKRALGLPFVITFHALGRVRRIYQGDQDGFPDERFEIEDQIVKEADGIIAECPQDEEDLLSLYQAYPEKIVIIPCGFDPVELWPVEKKLARQALGLPLEDRIVLQLGRMVPRKGVDNAVRGFAQMVKKHKLTGYLVIVGGESKDPDPEKTPEIGRLKKIAQEEGVSDRVIFTGQRGREEIKNYFSAADVFLSTPWYEPFGITPVEAMACGTPVIGSDVGGIKYTVADGETGYLVPANDPVALGNRLSDLFIKPERLERMSWNAIKRANKLFTWEHVARSISDFYDRLLQPVHSGSRKNGRSGSKVQQAPVALPQETSALNGHPALDPLAMIDDGFSNLISALSQSRSALTIDILQAASAITACLSRGNKVLVCGNGGSAAESQHFAGELVGRFLIPGRRALPVIALTTDTSFLTAWGNDIEFDQIFARQVEALGQSGDLLVGISTSGNSHNVVEAFQIAHVLGLTTVGLLGRDGGDLLSLSDIAIRVPSKETPRIQEVQLYVLHMICELVETQFANEPVEDQQAASILSTGVSASGETAWQMPPNIPAQLPPAE